ncbi:MAG: N-acetyltransferase family protein [Planctomycetota bacterium]
MDLIREARETDLPAITRIYNEAVCTSTASFDIRERTSAQQAAWFRAHGESHPVLVATDGQAVVGWGSLSPWIPRCACARTVEVSLYVDATFRGRGCGVRLGQALVEAGRAAGHHLIVASITAENAASCRLFTRLGFTPGGELPQVARKFDRWLDLALFYRVLDPA